MKFIILILSILCIVLAWLLFGSYRNVEHLKEDKSLQRIEADIAKFLSPSEARLSIRLNCHAILIKEHFGDNFTWGIDVVGMNYETGENYIVFRNDINGVSKSWFPKSEKHENGGVGRSVLVREEQYELDLLDSDRVSKVISRLEAVKSFCG